MGAAVAETLRIEPLTGAVGAEILDIDLASDLPESTIAGLRRALAEYGVIFFRDQQLTPERQKAFARRFGPIFIHPNFAATRPDHIVILPGTLREEIAHPPGYAREWGAKVVAPIPRLEVICTPVLGGREVR